MNQPSASVIIPAFNESTRIRETLETLLATVLPGEFEVFVVANGCRDDTADIARTVPGVTVVETPTGSKCHALNLGDDHASVFPRVYLDADVRLTTEDLRMLAGSVATDEALVASPTMRLDPTGVRPSVLSFYRVWRQLPYFSTAIGGGAYAVSKRGRQRWTSFPSVTADDAFVRLQFAPSERRVLSNCSFVIRPPRDLASLVRIKTRSRRGNLELSHRYPQLRRDDAPRNRQFVISLLARPAEWRHLAVYLCVVMRTLALARLKHLLRQHSQWERDLSSRSAARGAL